MPGVGDSGDATVRSGVGHEIGITAQPPYGGD